MTSSNRPEVSKKLYLLVVVLSVFIILIGWYGNRELKKMHHSMQSLYKDRVFPIVELTNLRFIYGTQILSTARQVKNGEIDFAQAEQKVAKAEERIASQWAIYQKSVFTGPETDLVKQIKEDMAQAKTEIKDFELLLHSKDKTALENFDTKAFHQTLNNVIIGLDDLVQLQVEISGDIYKKSGNAYDQAADRFYVLIALCLTFAAILSFVIVKNVDTIIRRLRESERKFRNIFENVQDIFYQTSMQGMFLELSPSVQHVLGYTKEELLDTPAKLLYFDETEREKVIEILHEKGELIDHEVRFKAKDGTLVYGLLGVNIIRNADGSPNHLHGVFKNITARVESEKKLRLSEAKLKEAQSIARMGSWDIDFTTNTHCWSDELYQIYGMEKNEISPSIEALLSFLHPDDREDAETEISETFRSLRDSFSYFRFIRKDGAMRYGYIEWKFELENQNYASRVYGILQDITERKTAEFEREKMLTDIIERNKIFEQFSYIVSHNLRGPVANILGISAAMKTASEGEGDELQQCLFQSVEELDEIIKTLNEILKIRNVSTEKKETVYFSELLGEMKPDLEKLPNGDTAKIITDFDSEKAFLLKSALRNVFFKLISNSIKYKQTDKDAVVHIRSSCRNGLLKISFKDNGMGLDLEKFGKKIFGISQRFHLNIGGKGIGLFLVKAQIELLGGTINVKSQPGVGTEFIIELPLKMALPTQKGRFSPFLNKI